MNYIEVIKKEINDGIIITHMLNYSITKISNINSHTNNNVNDNAKDDNTNNIKKIFKNYMTTINNNINNNIINNTINNTMNNTMNNTNNNDENIIKIKKFFKNYIHNVIFTENIEMEKNIINEVKIKWMMPNASSTNCNYYTNAGIIYNDKTIHTHIHIVINRIKKIIYEEHPELGRDWKIDFIVSKIC